MKTSNIQTTHSMAIIRGWIERGITFRDGMTTSDAILDWTVIGGTIIDNGDGTGILIIGGTTGTGDYPSFPVTTFGAVGDGTTDDTAAINAAIAALNTAGCGILYFPCGTYKVTAGLTTLSVPCTVMGDGGMTSADGPGSLINFTSTTGTLFTSSVGAVTFRDLAMAQTGGTATAGAAIVSTVSTLNRYDNLTILDFFTGIDIEDSLVWTMRDCYVQGVRKYGVRIRNTASPDSGDWVISNTSFATTVAADAAIRIDSSGGGKISNCKVNGGSGTSNFDYGIDLAVPTSVDTAILLVTNCSIENVSEGGIRGTTAAATSKYGNIVIGNCQFSILGNTGKAISLVATTAGDFYNVIIHGCEFGTAGTARSAIQLTKCDNVIITAIALLGFNDYFTSTTNTNLRDDTGGVAAGVQITGTPNSGDVPIASSGTAAAWGPPTGGSGSVATDAIWDAKGDLAAGTGANTAAKLTVGADDTILMADAAQTTGLKWVASATPSTQAFGDAAAAGTGDTFTRGDHKHAMPAAAVTTSGLTQATARLLGRTSASTGAIEEITVGTGLSLSAGSLTGSGLSDPMTTRGDVIYRNASNVTDRLAIGATRKLLKSDGTDVAYGYQAFIGCVAVANANTNLTTANTEYAVALAGADEIDTDGFHDPASNNTRITVPSGFNGKYRAVAYAYINAGAGQYLDLKIRVNGAAGTVLGQVRFTEQSGGNPIGIVIGRPAALVATDYVELYAMSSAAAVTAQLAWLSLEFLGV